MSGFDDEIEQRLKANSENAELKKSAAEFMRVSIVPKYSYNFGWLGRPIIQYPQDMIAMQELVWRLRPDLIIETGVAHGGSVIFYASLLELNAISGGPPEASVIGIELNLRPHNRTAIAAHPMSRRLEIYEGSSLSDKILDRVADVVATRSVVIVSLDSNHAHDHDGS